MSDFAKRQAELIRQREQKQREAEEQAREEARISVERERLKLKLSPGLWLTFRNLIAGKCEEVNRELGKEYYQIEETVQPKLLVIKPNPTANLRLDFFLNGCRIHYISGACTGDYLVGVDESNGQAILLDGEHPERGALDLEATAEYLLEECLEKAEF